MTDTRPVVEFTTARTAKVVDLAGFRISRGRAATPPTCKHLQIVLDETDRRAYCNECDAEIDPFTALVGMADMWSDMERDLDGRQKLAQQLVDEAKMLQASTFRRKVAKELDHTWSTNGGCPCPHCDTVLLGDDFKGKMSWHNGQMEMERRLADQRRREVETLTSYGYDDLRAKLSSMSIEDAAAELGVSVDLIEEWRGRLGVVDWRAKP